MITIGVKLDDETRQRLKRLGETQSRSPHWLMRVAIQQFLDREEQYEREKREDMERWDRFQMSGHAVPHTAAAAWLAKLADGKDGPCPE